MSPRALKRTLAFTLSSVLLIVLASTSATMLAGASTSALDLTWASFGLVSWAPCLLACSPKHRIVLRSLLLPIFRLLCRPASLLPVYPGHRLVPSPLHRPVFLLCLGLHLCWPVSRIIDVCLGLLFGRFSLSV